MAVDFYKRTWFTSDWHLGHKHILTFCPNRPGQNLIEMEEILIRNYNSAVKPDHVCYFLGDFCFSGSGYARQALRTMNGKKILITGNHDLGHQSLINVGFDAVLNIVEFKVGGLHITASHFPLAGIKREACENFPSWNGTDNWHGEAKYKRTMLVPEDKGQDIHLHGHLHSPNRGYSEPILGKQFDVGVDANNMRPVSLNHIIKALHKRSKL